MKQDVPVFPSWIELSVNGRRPQHARVNTSPIVIVHIRLASLADEGSPARVVHSALQSYFPPPHTSNLVYIDAPYNIHSTEDAKKYRTQTQKKLEVLKRYHVRPLAGESSTDVVRFERARILLFIYTHSEARSGDLFYGEGSASMDLGQARHCRRDNDYANYIHSNHLVVE